MWDNSVQSSIDSMSFELEMNDRQYNLNKSGKNPILTVKWDNNMFQFEIEIGEDEESEWEEESWIATIYEDNKPGDWTLEPASWIYGYGENRKETIDMIVSVLTDTVKMYDDNDIDEKSSAWIEWCIDEDNEVINTVDEDAEAIWSILDGSDEIDEIDIPEEEF